MTKTDFAAQPIPPLLEKLLTEMIVVQPDDSPTGVIQYGVALRMGTFMEPEPHLLTFDFGDEVYPPFFERDEAQRRCQYLQDDLLLTTRRTAYNFADIYGQVDMRRWSELSEREVTLVLANTIAASLFLVEPFMNPTSDDDFAQRQVVLDGIGGPPRYVVAHTNGPDHEAEGELLAMALQGEFAGYVLRALGTPRQTDQP